MGKRKTNDFFKIQKKFARAKEIKTSSWWSKSEHERNVHVDKLKKRDQDENDESIKFKEVAKRQSLVNADMFFSYNNSLGPPYKLLLDTNFINFSVQNKLDIVKAGMDCLYSKVIPCVTDCVIAELEKLGKKFSIALAMAKDPRFQRLTCNHKGIYADDCICNRVEGNPVYIVATCDRDLKRRVRKMPGVPIMYIKGHKFTVERLPDVTGMGASKQ